MTGIAAKGLQRGIVVPYDMELINASVPDDTTDLGQNCRGLLVGVGGLLNVKMQDGATLTGVPFIAGINPGYFSEVLDSTGLTGPAENVWKLI